MPTDAMIHTFELDIARLTEPDIEELLGRLWRDHYVTEAARYGEAISVRTHAPRARLAEDLEGFDIEIEEVEP